MARVTAEQARLTKIQILEAARNVLQKRGLARLSTRAIADEAGVPMSQIQYHFGSKDGMILALFNHMNDQLLIRQQDTFTDSTLSFAEKWSKACDFFDEDIESGYVRVLQELTAMGWSNPAIGDPMRDGIMAWVRLLKEQAQEFIDQHAPDSPLDADELVALIEAAFMGAESLILLGLEDQGVPYRRALRKFGKLLEYISDR